MTAEFSMQFTQDLRQIRRIPAVHFYLSMIYRHMLTTLLTTLPNQDVIGFGGWPYKSRTNTAASRW
jgi:hypothetical protein